MGVLLLACEPSYHWGTVSFPGWWPDSPLAEVTVLCMLRDFLVHKEKFLGTPLITKTSHSSAPPRQTLVALQIPSLAWKPVTSGCEEGLAPEHPLSADSTLSAGLGCLLRESGTCGCCVHC